MSKKDTQFKPGQSGNPSGRPKLPDEIKKASALTKQKFIQIASEFLSMNQASVDAHMKRPESTMLELLVGGIVVKAVKDQDYLRATFLLDRVIGKVSYSDEDESTKRRQELMNLTDRELDAAVLSIAARKFPHLVKHDEASVQTPTQTLP